MNIITLLNILSMAMSTMTTFSSWNVNGLRSIDKIENVLSYAKTSNFSFLALQETFWDDEITRLVRSKWDGDIHVNNCEDKNRRGVALLVNPKLQNMTTTMYNDDKGRLLKIRLDNQIGKIDIFVIYAPNTEIERIEILKTIERNLDINIPFIIMGDFNIIQYPDDRSHTLKYRNDKSRDYLFEMYAKYNCIDVWRYRNMDKKVFSRTQCVENSLKQSRIDFIIASRNLLRDIQNIYYKYTTMSDHNMICMKIDMTKQERGPGIWIHNNSLLDEKEYIENINMLIETEKQCRLYGSNLLTWWDNLKFKIKQYSIRYSRKRARQHNQYYWELHRRIENESRRAANNPDYDVLHLTDLKKELESLEMKTCRGAVLRSKAQWAIEGERNTRYFLQLEKQRQQGNNIKEIVNSEGDIIRDTDGILEEEYKYYEKLYTKTEIDNERQKKYLSIMKEKVDEESRVFCDEQLDIEEIRDAVIDMNRNKSPGTDGLTTEFYQTFWGKLEPVLFKVYLQIFEQGIMSRSMRKGMITLIYKQKGERNSLQNYRPISLLNVDYKILTRVFANRLKKVIGSIINKNQTCCIPNRAISDTIASVRDLIDYCDIENVQGYIIKIDQQKAFDKVDHKYLFNVIEKFGFGMNFQKWIQIFYKDILSAVKCNGHLTPFFKVERSVRQGCPISAMLYVLSAEPLAMYLNNNEDIHGIPVPNSDLTSLVYQHADDTTVTVTDKKSVGKVFDVFKEYEEISGSKVNVQKSEIYVLGNAPKAYLPNIKILEDAIQILGVYLGDKKHVDILNWKDKIVKMNRIVNMWKQRNLSLLGRATVITNLLTSRVWYTLMVQTIPDWAIDAIKKLSIDFLWKGHKHLVKYDTIIAKKDKGGLNIPDISMKRSAFRLKTIARYIDNNNESIWSHFMSYNLSRYKSLKLTGEILYLNLEKTEIKKLTDYYQEVLQAYDQICSHVLIEPISKSDIQNQPLFNNHNYDVKIAKEFKHIFEMSTIITIADIIYDVIPGFFPTEAIVDMIHERYPDISVTKIEECFDILIESIPEIWKHVINRSEYMENTNSCISIEVGIDIIPMNKCGSKQFYSVLLEKKSKTPISSNFWETKLDKHNHECVWKNVFNNNKPTKWAEVDFKIAHNALFTQEKLYKIKMTDTNICTMCNKTTEDMMHMMLYCPFNFDLITYIRDLLYNMCYNLNTLTFNKLCFEKIFLFGVTTKYENINCNIINLMLSCARYTIYSNRNMKIFEDKYIEPVKLFKFFFKNYVRESKCYYENNDKLGKFKALFIQKNEYIELIDNNLTINI